MKLLLLCFALSFPPIFAEPTVIIDNQTIIVGETIPATDHSVSPGHPNVCPSGYVPVLPNDAHRNLVGKFAWKLIGGNYGDKTPFEISGSRYLGVVDSHFGKTKVCPQSCWHKGVSVYKAKN